MVTLNFLIVALLRLTKMFEVNKQVYKLRTDCHFAFDKVNCYLSLHEIVGPGREIIF